MNNNENNWIYSFDKDKNISFAIASVLNGYFDNKYYGFTNIDNSIYFNARAIQAVHNLSKSQANEVIKKAKLWIKKKGEK